MTIDEIMSIERYGLIATINEYTREHYVRNYTNILSKLTYPKDKALIIKISQRLIDWYKVNIDSILNNQHIINKSEHEKSYLILKELLSVLLKEAD